MQVHSKNASTSHGNASHKTVDRLSNAVLKRFEMLAGCMQKMLDTPWVCKPDGVSGRVLMRILISLSLWLGRSNVL